MSAPDRAALLERAARQDIRYDERAQVDYQRALVRDACKALDCEPSRASHWVRNRNADLWKIEATDRTWLLKILTSKPMETLECEYGHLEALYEVAAAVGTFRVPRPRLLFAGRSAYVMEFVAFRPLVERILARGDRDRDLAAALRACGRALATIHVAWAEEPQSFDAAAVAADLRHLPWASTARESATLRRLLARLDGRSFPHARLYLDYDPVNVGCALEGPPLLLDPPECRAVDAVQWDLGVFLFGLRRAVWRRPLAARRHAERLPGMRRAFVEGYAAAADDPLGAGGGALIGLAEVARLGQLWGWWLRPFGFRHRAVGIARALYAWPLLRAARRSVIRELERLE